MNLDELPEYELDEILSCSETLADALELLEKESDPDEMPGSVYPVLIF